MFHALLAFAGGLDDRSIGVNTGRLLEERTWLFLPYADAHLVHDVHQ